MASPSLMHRQQCRRHPVMTSLAVVLKSEITRVARKEARAQNSQLKKASSQHRTDVAALKRRVLELEKLVKGMAKRGPKSIAPTDVDADDGPAVHRYSAKGFAAQRKRLGLSATELGVLLGVSNQSVYKWEEAMTRPRASNMPAIAALRRMSKKEAAEKLASLSA